MMRTMIRVDYRPPVHPTPPGTGAQSLAVTSMDPAGRERPGWAGSGWLAGAAGDRGPGPLAVGRDRDAPVVAVAVGRGDHHVLARPGGADVPGGVDHRRGHEVHCHGPAA